MNTVPRIAGAGFFAVDVVLGHEGDAVASSLGGSAGNVLSILSALGWKSMPFAVIGNDRPAMNLESRWEELGVDTRFVHRSSGRSTPVVFQHQPDPCGGRAHRYSFDCPKCGHSSAPKAHPIPAEFLHALHSEEPEADVFYFDRASTDNVELAEYFSTQGSLVVFEPSSTGGDDAVFRRAIAAADIVKYADDRFEGLSIGEVSEVTLEIQTMGSRGLKFRSPVTTHGEWVHVDAFNVPHIVDAAGSGDWCTVGVIRALMGLDGTSIEEASIEHLMGAMNYGQALAGLNCMTVGAQGILRHLNPADLHNPAEWYAFDKPPMIRPSLAVSAGISGTSWSDDELLDLMADELPLGSSSFPCCPH